MASGHFGSAARDRVDRPLKMLISLSRKRNAPLSLSPRFVSMFSYFSICRTPKLGRERAGLRFEFFGKSLPLSLSPSLSSGIYIDGSTLRGESNGLDSHFTCLTELPQFLWHNAVLVDSWAWIIPSPTSSFVKFVEAQPTTPPKFCKEK